MDSAKTVDFTDRMGEFFSQQYGLAPVVGRCLGYLSVCTPSRQSINELAQALRASRTAIANAVKQLEHYHLVKRNRPIGSKVDLFWFASDQIERNGFDPELYLRQAELAREGLSLVSESEQVQREALQKIASLGEFLAARVPALLNEWREHYKAEKKAKS